MTGDLPLADWTGCPSLTAFSAAGRFMTLAPLDMAVHEGALWDAFGGSDSADLFRYMPLGPYTDRARFAADFTNDVAMQDDWRTFVMEVEGRAAGMASYMAIEPDHGSAEVGAVVYGRALQRTAAATEAQFLLADHAFAQGYRRYEWKCNAANAASMRAAKRLGFSYEGTFRQHRVVKGRNRDTAWFSIMDEEWPARRRRLRSWLDLAGEGVAPSLSQMPL